MKAPAFSYYMHDGPTVFSIELAGALAAEGAMKLEQDCRSACAVVGKKELVVDLSFVTEIDPVGRQHSLAQEWGDRRSKHARIAGIG
jgi:anti-anti-sigma regulatory factor